ncbi:MAG TPA: hypothetical protein VNM38_00550 [Solirubrobacterales bacterium]|nr:hypothetical protein [Solirubrobacterales bacterium]
MTKPKPEDQPGCLGTLVKMLVAAFFAAPLFLVLFTSGALTEARGSEAFYGGAIGLLGALVISIAFQARMAADALWQFFGRGDTILMVAILFGYLGTLIGGGASALTALQDCGKNFCGSSGDFNNVILALISGSTFLATVFIVSVYLHLVDLKKDDQDAAES